VFAFWKTQEDDKLNFENFPNLIFLSFLTWKVSCNGGEKCRLKAKPNIIFSSPDKNSKES